MVIWHKLEKIIKTSNGEEKIETESCPFWEPRGISDYPTCKKEKIRCQYGLTEIKVPRGCPLRKGPIEIKYTLKTKEVEE